MHDYVEGKERTRIDVCGDKVYLFWENWGGTYMSGSGKLRICLGNKVGINQCKECDESILKEIKSIPDGCLSSLWTHKNTCVSKS